MAENTSIYQKILAVQKAVEAVPKRGYNAFHKYSYATEADILEVKKTLNENGLIVLPTTIEESKGFKPDGKSWASVTLLFKVIDVDTGEAIESQFNGYAEDANDKAIYKATTGANKYFYLKFFGMATEDDPEREDAQQPQQGPRRNNQGYQSQARPAQATNAQQPMSEAAQIKQNIKNLVRTHGISWNTVTEVTGVSALLSTTDLETLQRAYGQLQGHVQQGAA